MSSLAIISTLTILGHGNAISQIISRTSFGSCGKREKLWTLFTSAMGDVESGFLGDE
jgi:hypothetical protein